MQVKDATKTALNQILKLIKTKHFVRFIKTLDADKYVKKFFYLKFIYLMIYGQLNQFSSLREISCSLNNKKLQKTLGLLSISPSQISRKLRAFNPEIAQQLLKNLVRYIRIKSKPKTMSSALVSLSRIDSTTMSLPLTRYLWAFYKKTKSGVKLHLRLNYIDGNVFPDLAIVTEAKKADKKMMKPLVATNEDGNDKVFNVFDRAYLDYKKFDEYCNKGILFATRLKKNAIKEILGQNPLNTN